MKCEVYENLTAHPVPSCIIELNHHFVRIHYCRFLLFLFIKFQMTEFQLNQSALDAQERWKDKPFHRYKFDIILKYIIYIM